MNYSRVISLLKRNGKVRGVIARDLESGRELEIEARVVINATGVFSDAIRRMDEPRAAQMLAPSQGAHIVLDKSFLPGETAIIQTESTAAVELPGTRASGAGRSAVDAHSSAPACERCGEPIMRRRRSSRVRRSRGCRPS